MRGADQFRNRLGAGLGKEKGEGQERGAKDWGRERKEKRRDKG